MAVKFASSFGAHVTMLSSSASKQKDAESLGAHAFACTKEASTFTQLQNSFDFILDTVSAPHDYNAYLSLLKRDGTMILVVAPELTHSCLFFLILKRRRLVGSLIVASRKRKKCLMKR
jgi:uncharacterized zinc-type alcohol dehydrogenase-like protein